MRLILFVTVCIWTACIYDNPPNNSTDGQLTPNYEIMTDAQLVEQIFISMHGPVNMDTVWYNIQTVKTNYNINVKFKADTVMRITFYNVDFRHFVVDYDIFKHFTTTPIIIYNGDYSNWPDEVMYYPGPVELGSTNACASSMQQMGWMQERYPERRHKFCQTLGS